MTCPIYASSCLINFPVFFFKRKDLVSRNSKGGLRSLKKSVSSRFKDFRKKSIIQNNPTFAVVIARKNTILEIAKNKINEIFTAQKHKLNTYFGSNLI